MTKLGAFTFVLHSHLPYVRLAGRWPHGEEWIHEAACDTYIPLLQCLYDLRDEGVPFRLTLGITPVLAEQLNDPTVLDHLDTYLDMKIAAAEGDIAHFSALKTDAQDDPNTQIANLASWYREGYSEIKKAFNERFNRDLIGAFRRLQDEGYIEIMTSAATHAYLPLLAQDSSIRAQLALGIETHERLFGRKPRAIWLPECAYRPAYTTDGGDLRAGIEHFLAEHDLTVFFSETHAITGGRPVGVAEGDVIGPYGEIKRRYVLPKADALPVRDASIFRAYQVVNSGDDSSTSGSGIAVIGRNATVGQQVWSSSWGYPGDFDYREFHKKAGTSGLQYWRVTGDTIDLQHKDLYYPEWAAFKVEQHAEHFAHLVGDLMRGNHGDNDEYGLIAANYDTELFGHWWYEGVTWLGQVLRHLVQDECIDLTTASAHIDAHPPQEMLHIPESSWGAGGNHFTWDNGETHWMWRPIHEAERRMQALADQFTDPSEDEAFVLAQVAREVLLMQSSDWPFLVTTMQARNYAIQRFTQHDERFRRLAASLEQGHPDRTFAEELFALDNIFAALDYRLFRSQS